METGQITYVCRQLDTIRYDTIEEINVDSKAEYTA